MEYDHFAYGEALASSFKDISHTPDKRRFFTAFGLEDLTNLDDQLSSVTGTILIAVDGCESESEDNEADGLNDKQMYSFIVARNTVSGEADTINKAAKHCKKICKQIRNVLLQDPDLRTSLDRNTQINGIGPIGDNFYGTVLTFSLNLPEEFFVDPNYFL
ncbi:hypothetical protein NXV35_21620 [Bacteroides faecis]|nr:hypothetical protein [Bacteroides faecis]